MEKIELKKVKGKDAPEPRGPQDKHRLSTDIHFPPRLHSSGKKIAQELNCTDILQPQDCTAS